MRLEEDKGQSILHKMTALCCHTTGEGCMLSTAAGSKAPLTLKFDNSVKRGLGVLVTDKTTRFDLRECMVLNVRTCQLV